MVCQLNCREYRDRGVGVRETGISGTFDLLGNVSVPVDGSDDLAAGVRAPYLRSTNRRRPTVDAKKLGRVGRVGGLAIFSAIW